MTSHQTSEHGRWVRSVVESYEGRLLRYAASIVGNLELARDIVQDTFLRLCRQDRASIDGRVAAWLFAVCRNRAIDVVRKESRMGTVPAERLAECESRETSPDVACQQQSTAQRIRQLVDQLPDNQREVVRLKFHGGLSYREIGQITERSPTNVGYLLHAAIGRIRRQLDAGP